MIYQHSKHVKIECTLKKGDLVTCPLITELNQQKLIIIDIKVDKTSLSLFKVKFAGYKDWVDSNYIDLG